VNTDVTLNTEDSIVKSLVAYKAIQKFVHEGNGKYSFNVVVDIVFREFSEISGITMSQGFSFNTN